MGLIFSKKTEPKDELERIVKTIKSIDLNIENLKRQNLYVSRLFMISFSMGITAFALNYLHQKPNVSFAFVLIFSIISYIILYLLLTTILTRLYSYRTNRQYITKEKFIKRKTEIMEEIKEKVNFNVARELILKYGTPEDINDINNVTTVSNSPEKLNIPERLTPTKPLDKSQKIEKVDTKPQQALPPPKPIQNPPIKTPQALIKQFETPKPKPIRPFVGAARTPVDKLVDFVIGDGPNNRYALICRKCFTHNGMALPDEFEKLSFCCYRCNTFNPSKKFASTNELNKRPSTTSESTPNIIQRRASETTIKENAKMQAIENLKDKEVKEKLLDDNKDKADSD